MEWIDGAGEDAAVALNAVKAGKGAYGYNAGAGESRAWAAAERSLG
jgi:hypothetical protein